MNGVLRFVIVAVAAGAGYWLLHQALWPDDTTTWVAALAWGGWMTGFVACLGVFCLGSGIRAGYANKECTGNQLESAQ
jgi:hypothetical protein